MGVRVRMGVRVGEEGGGRGVRVGRHLGLNCRPTIVKSAQQEVTAVI